jgi:hypothetical protein
MCLRVGWDIWEELSYFASVQERMSCLVCTVRRVYMKFELFRDTQVVFVEIVSAKDWNCFEIPNLFRRHQIV